MQNRIKLILLSFIILLFVFSFSCVDKVATANNSNLQTQINSIQTTVAQHTEQISDLSLYTQVTKLTATELTITTKGAGNYPVIVALFGTISTDSKVTVSSSNCAVVIDKIKESSTLIYIIIIPSTNWEVSNAIVLNISQVGSVKYATAYIGVR